MVVSHWRVDQTMTHRTTYARDLWRRNARAFNDARNRRKWARWLVMAACTELAFPEAVQAVNRLPTMPARRPILRLRRGS